MSTREQSLSIPASVRAQVNERDCFTCRVCGQTKGLVHHHIRYGGDEVGMGGRRFHHVENVITVGDYFEHDCHRVVHASKHLWVPLLEAATRVGGVTALQLLRWVRTGAVEPGAYGLPTDDWLRRARRTGRG